MKFRHRELQKCAEREVALRKRVYAKHGKTSPKDAAEIEMMEEIAELFRYAADLEDDVDAGHPTLQA